MKPGLLDFICCPECREPLSLKNEVYEKNEIKSGGLLCRNAHEYRIINFIPRFVKADAYTLSFSYEWTRFSETQLDSKIGKDLSESQFQGRIDFPLTQMKGKLVLDAGCGMGRYADIVTKYGGIVVGIDLSYAIESAFKNIGLRDNVHIIQGDILKPPFKDEIFDFIYSFGVLHHTPDAQGAFKCLARHLKKNGKFSLFVYDSYEKAIVYSSDFWRKITTHLPLKVLYYLCFISVPLYYVYKIPVIGNSLKAVFVISMRPEWKIRWLDTFDWYSPKYQSKHTHAEVFRWFDQMGFRDIKIFDYGVTMQGTKT
jgi:SAM-dependent methyltransferase